jgi:3-deoxy-manno-octulosonate cytidylyltransferase (CMP-KDO synthetase)
MYFSRAPIPYLRSGSDPRDAKYLRHVGLYGFRREFLAIFPELPKSTLEQAECLEQLRVLESGRTIKVAVVDHTYPGVDTKEQLAQLHLVQ